MSVLGLADKVVAVDRALGRARIAHAFGGALALAYYATPRATVDIDVNVFVGAERYSSVATALGRVIGGAFPSKGTVDRDGQIRVWWGRTPIDLFFSYDEVHEAMRTAVRSVPFGKATIPILAPEHLLVAKVAFDRPKDWLDIDQMLIAVDVLDIDEIRRWLIHLMDATDARVLHFHERVSKLRGGS